VVQYSHYYANSLYGIPGTGKSGSLNFSLSNNVEMKVRNDKDTTGTKPFNIVSLLDNFSVNGSYNLAADSMRWSILNTSLRIKIKNYSLSLSGGFDPYMNQLKGTSLVRVNKLRWEHGGFPRFLGTSTSYSYTLNNDTFKKLFGNKAGKSDKPTDSGQANATPQDQTTGGKSTDSKDKKIDKDEDGYEKLAIPWSISINYSIRYGQTSLIDPKNPLEYKMDFTHNLSLSGNISLTQNWKINASSSYDFKYKQFTYTNLSVTRNLHCWTMTASIVPFGYYKSYSFHLGVNASMLKDLKYDKQSGYGTNNITWY
jgi:hypothetical protein